MQNVNIIESDRESVDSDCDFDEPYLAYLASKKSDTKQKSEFIAFTPPDFNKSEIIMLVNFYRS